MEEGYGDARDNPNGMTPEALLKSLLAAAVSTNVALEYWKRASFPENGRSGFFDD